MKLPPPLHGWRLSPRQAMRIQAQLAARVSQTPPAGPLRRVAGLDAAFSADERLCVAGVVLWDRETGRVLETHTVTARLRFPYIPGLLSFREVPALLAALRRLRHPPDVLLCDGQGLAHPRRFGLASHLGVWCDLPAVGCAKSRLLGTFPPPGRTRGARSALWDGGERVGTVLRTRTGVRPVFVSIGHRMDLPTAEQLVLQCAVRYRLPEPTRLADRLVAAAKRQLTGPT